MSSSSGRNARPTARRLAAALLVASGAVSWGAQAQPARDPAAAEALFNAAKELLKAGDWAAACPKLQASMDLDPAVGTQLKIAKCHEHDGKLALAWYAYQRAQQLNREKTDQTEGRRRELDDFTRAAIASLEPRVPRLRIRVVTPMVEPGPAPALPPGLELLRNGAAIPVAALGEALPIDPGDHEIVAHAPGHRAERRLAQAVEGKVTDVEITLTRDAVPPPTTFAAAFTPPARIAPHAPPARDRRAPDPARRDGTPQRVAGIVVGGLGVVGLGAAGVFGLRTLSKVSDSNEFCPDRCKPEGITLREEATESQTVGLVLLGVGAAAVAGGIAIYLTAPDASAKSAPVHGVALVFGPGSLGGAARW